MQHLALKTPRLKSLRPTDGPLVLAAQLWDGFGSGRARFVRTVTRALEVGLKGVGVSLAALVVTTLVILAIFFSLWGANALIGYDFSENIFQFLWNYRDWSAYYSYERPWITGHFGLIFGAAILFLSPYFLFGTSLASAVGVFHWLDRPFRRRRFAEGIWCMNGAADPASLGELPEEQLSRPTLGSPRVRTWLGRVARSTTVLFTLSAYLLLLTVLKAVVQSVPGELWFFVFAILPPLGFGLLAMFLCFLVAGFFMNLEVSVGLVNRLLDGETSIKALRDAFQSIGTSKKGHCRRR